MAAGTMFTVVMEGVSSQCLSAGDMKRTTAQGVTWMIFGCPVLPKWKNLGIADVLFHSDQSYQLLVDCFLPAMDPDYYLTQ